MKYAFLGPQRLRALPLYLFRSSPVKTKEWHVWAGKQYYWSPHLARSQLFFFVVDSICPSVCHKHCFFFVSNGIDPFLAAVINDKSYKTLFFDFWFRPPNPQNLLPKICTKSPVSRLVWQIDRRCLCLPGGFRGWPNQWTMQNVVGPTLVAMATKFGLGAEGPPSQFWCALARLAQSVARVKKFTAQHPLRAEI